jgi:hypothetical protein
MHVFGRIHWLCVLALLATSTPQASAQRRAQTAVRCFGVPGVTNCIGGRFLQYWESNGGLSVFGYPLTPERQETTPDGTFTVQYFERNRFELHPELPRPYDVALGRLGAERLAATGRDWQTAPRPAQQRDCDWWPATRFQVCGEFLRFWQRQGIAGAGQTARQRSLALWGLPLTEARFETNSSGDTVLTQWFERARLELHPTLGIVLGRIGAEQGRDVSPDGDAMDQLIVDLDEAWRVAFRAAGWRYTPPRGVLTYSRAIQTACGPANPARDDTFYCERALLVYVDTADLAKDSAEFGATAETTILAHEWGHHLQVLRGINEERYEFIELELHADCLTGVYFASALERGRIAGAAVAQAEALLARYGDPPTLPPEDPRAHGTAAQRQQAFGAGLRGGLAACALP